MKECIKAITNRFLGLFYPKSQCLSTLAKVIEEKRDPNILFVCLGNICRSAYAEGYLKSILSNNISVSSAGLRTSNGKAAYIGALEEAKLRNIDLQGHKTTFLTREIVEGADIIFCMEPSQIREVLKMTKDFSKTILPLGVFAEDNLSTAIITDPYGKDSQSFKECFDIIDSACNYINSTIKRGEKL